MSGYHVMYKGVIKAEVHQTLLRTLTDCASLRAQRNFGRPLQWVTYERETMYRETNRLRAELGKKSIEMAEILTAENLATGHVDYASKFALYCAELVVDLA